MRLVLLTYDLPEANRVVGRLLAEFGEDVAGIVTSSVPVAGRTRWGGTRHLLQRCGVGFPTWIEWHRLAGRVAAGVGRLTGRRLTTGALSGLVRRHRVPLVRSAHVNNAKTRETIAGWEPDLLVSVYLNQKLRPRTTQLATHGAINFHPALLPRNRGLLPCFWSLANGDRQTGITVHRIDEELDTGDVLATATVPIEPNDSFVGLSHRCATAGGELLVDCIRAIERDEARPQPQVDDGATYFSWPNRSALKRFRKRGHTFGTIKQTWDAVNRAA